MTYISRDWGSFVAPSMSRSRSISRGSRDSMASPRTKRRRLEGVERRSMGLSGGTYNNDSMTGRS